MDAEARGGGDNCIGRVVEEESGLDFGVGGRSVISSITCPRQSSDEQDRVQAFKASCG